MSEQIFVQIDDERVELTGQALEDFLVNRAQMQAEYEANEEAKTTRDAVRTSALAKLAALGLIEEELATLSV